MTDFKLRQLFDQARKEALPVPPPDFEFETLRRIRAEQRPASATVFDQLNALFPRLALAAVLMIALCVAGDLWFSSAADSDLASGVAQVSENWLFAADGL